MSKIVNDGKKYSTSVEAENFGNGATNSYNDDYDDYGERKQLVNREISTNRLTVWKTTVLVTGELMGAGVLALPYAAVSSGWYSIGMVIALGLGACYGGVKLGRCWQIVTERFSEYNSSVRDPYATIGYVCYGKCMREFVRINLIVMLFGGSVVILLLAGDMTLSLLHSIGSKPPLYCYWILIFAVVLLPPMYLGTPKDLWITGILALATSLSALVLIIVGITNKAIHSDINKVVRPEVTVSSVSLAFGTIAFMVGGAPTFPTIQNDMKDKSKFHIAVMLSSIVIIGSYLTVCLLSMLTLGKDTPHNILTNFSPQWMANTAQLLIAVHLMMAFFILINPVNQEFEELLNVPHRLGWKRITVRTAVMILLVVVAETVPKFSHLLDVIGASVMTLLTFILPAVFYMKLTSIECLPNSLWTKWEVPMYEKVLLLCVIVLGTVGGIISTYSSVKEMVSKSSFALPCYVDSSFSTGN